MRVKNTAIVHVGAHAQHIGRYDLSYDLRNNTITDSTFQLVANKPGMMPGNEGIDQVVAKILNPWQQELQETIAELKNDRLQPAMAHIAAQAAMRTLPIDAAFINRKSGWGEWRRGGLTRQDILNGFRVEREPVGTPGSSSLYLMEMKGEDLLHARAVMKDSAYLGPVEINPVTLYTVAMQKRQALEQKKFFARDIAVSPPRPIAELWEVVVAYAADLKSRNLALDEGNDARQVEKLLAHLPGDTKKHPAL